MTTILISVLTPVVLLGWWALIVTTARDNEVVPQHALIAIWMRRFLDVWTREMVPKANAVMAEFGQAIQTAARAIATMRGPIAEMHRVMQQAGWEE